MPRTTKKPPERKRSTSGAQRAVSSDNAGAAVTEASSTSSNIATEATADDSLIVFVGAPPANADRLVVIASGAAGEQLLQDRTAAECKREPHFVAEQISVACERWAIVEGRLVRFRASWMRGEKSCATHAWQAGSNEDDQQVLDGSVMSVLVQLQRVFDAQAQSIVNERKLSLEKDEMVKDSWQLLFSVQNQRITALEKDNDGLRDRLRKLDDVGTELALENARADIEQRGRTADLLEKRVLPIAQAFLAQKMQETAASVTATPVSTNSHQEHSQ